MTWSAHNCDDLDDELESEERDPRATTRTDPPLPSAPDPNTRRENLASS